MLSSVIRLEGAGEEFIFDMRRKVVGVFIRCCSQAWFWQILAGVARHACALAWILSTGYWRCAPGQLRQCCGPRGRLDCWVAHSIRHDVCGCRASGRLRATGSAAIMGALLAAVPQHLGCPGIFVDDLGIGGSMRFVLSAMFALLRDLALARWRGCSTLWHRRRRSARC